MPYLEENVDGVFQLTVETWPRPLIGGGGGGGAVDALLVDLSDETPGFVQYDASAVDEAGVTVMIPAASILQIMDLPPSSERDSFRVTAVRASGTGPIGIIFDASSPVLDPEEPWTQFISQPGWAVAELAPSGTSDTWFVSSFSPSPVPSPYGGTNGDVLTILDDEYVLAAPAGGADLSDATPEDLGTAAAGVSTDASRADHVHDMPTAADVGAVPTSRTINGLDLTTNRTLSAADVGAAATSHVHAGADITSGTVATARLGSGTASSSTFLRGDQTWVAVGATGVGTPTAYSGGFYLPPGRLQFADAVVHTFVNGAMYYMLGFSPFAWRITAARSRVASSGVGATLRRLVLSCDSSQMPSAVLWQEALDASSTGTKDTTGLSITVPAGPYLIGGRAEGANVGAVVVGQVSQYQRSNMVAGESVPSDGTLKASTGTGTVTTPPVPDTLWAAATGMGSLVSFRWEVA